MADAVELLDFSPELEPEPDDGLLSLDVDVDPESFDDDEEPLLALFSFLPDSRLSVR